MNMYSGTGLINRICLFIYLFLFLKYIIQGLGGKILLSILPHLGHDLFINLVWLAFFELKYKEYLFNPKYTGTRDGQRKQISSHLHILCNSY